jgi:3-oxoacyl-[acyl-carrier protein] reductase
MKLKNKTILITGASRGIGYQTAYEVAKEGANVIINYNNSIKQAKELEQLLKKEFGTKTLLVKANIKNEQEIINMVNESINHFQKIDVLINNAGICKDTTVEDKTKENFMEILETNLVGTFLVSKYVSQHMLKEKSGKIINIASTNATYSYYPESLDYDASKAGIVSLTHNLALHLSPYITVNAISPGWTKTDMNKDLSKEQIKKEEEKILLKRFAQPQEIAKVITFLSSDDANYINNQIINVDGGEKYE